MIKNYKIYTTPTCKNCPGVKAFLKETGLEGQEVNAATPDGRNDAVSHGVMAVPTVFFYDETGSHIETARSINEIKRVLHGHESEN